MRLVSQWLHRPQQVWLRRAVFQIHLWLGLALGLYIVVLSTTGSLLVFRIELDRYLATPRAQLRVDASPMPADQIREAAARAYPEWTVTELYEGRYAARGGRGGGRGRLPDPTASVYLERDGETVNRLFDPYTGTDLGDSFTRGQAFILWVVRLHDELLLESDGQWWNGAISLAFTLAVLTGLVVWWPGAARWTRSLRIGLKSGWRRINWDLHSALGIWLSLFLLMWGVSGWYLGVPGPLGDLAAQYLDSPGQLTDRPSDALLAWLTRLHFGRWRDPVWGLWLKALWATLGLVPALMAVTGAVMWWNRVVRRRGNARAT